MYIVASQGASPSGRLTAVLGLSGSLGRLVAFWSGEALFELDGTRGLCVVGVDRMPAGVTFCAVLGGVFADTAVSLVSGLAIVGEAGPAEFISKLASFAGPGVLVLTSVSSSKTWLPKLFPLVLNLELPDISSSSMLPLKLRFLGIGVSRSNLSAGIGSGLEVRTGILDPFFRTTGLPYFLAARPESIAATSSGVRKSQPSLSGDSTLSSAMDKILGRFSARAEAQ